MSNNNTQDVSSQSKAANPSTEHGQILAEETHLLNRMAARIASLRSLAPDAAQLSIMA